MAIDLDKLPTIIITLTLAAAILVSGFLVLAGLQEGVACETGYTFNASANSCYENANHSNAGGTTYAGNSSLNFQEAMDNVSGYLPVVGTIIGVALILGVVNTHGSVLLHIPLSVVADRFGLTLGYLPCFTAPPTLPGALDTLNAHLTRITVSPLSIHARGKDVYPYAFHPRNLLGHSVVILDQPVLPQERRFHVNNKYTVIDLDYFAWVYCS